jgi:pimeloyl-ACP methyl ester carboxylesterase
MKVFTHSQNHYLTHQSSKIYFEIHGDKSLPALLFLHGGVGNIEEMNSLAEQFANDHFIIGIDSRGHGKSTIGDKDLSYELLQKDAEEVLTHLKIDSVKIIGFSDGGIVGWRMALGEKIQVSHLTTIGSSWHHEKDAESIKMYEQIDGPWWKEKHPEYFERYMHLSPDRDFNKLVKKAVRMWLDTSSSGYPDERIKNLKSKLLIIRGDDDHLTPLKSQLEIKEMLPKARFLNIPFASHVAHETHAEICKQMISEHIRQ